MNVSRPPEIKCLFFCEFHPTEGPKIVHQVPEEFPLEVTFDAAYNYLITKPHLYDRLIAVVLDNLKLAGCPKGIEDKKYDRNSFIFNFVFVFDADVDVAPYEPVIRKLGAVLRDCEVENGFLTNEVTRNKLPDILQKVLNQLNSQGYCHVLVDDVNALNLKVTPPLPHPPTVKDYDVPIFSCDVQNLSDLEWDLGIQQIIPHIDGFNHLAKIAGKTDMDREIVRASLQHLAGELGRLYRFVTLISIFQYSNMYVVTDGLRQLYRDTQLQEWVVQQVALQGHSATFSDVFRLYCSLEHGVTVKDMCLRHDPRSLGIDERLLVQVGSMLGFIRRLHKYPMLKKTEVNLPELLAKVKSLLDGTHHYDEVCCAESVSYEEVDKAIEEVADSLDGDAIAVFWK